jgi:DNA-binding response OmpR family regulator
MMNQTNGQLQGRHILIVDDDADIRESIDAVMRSEGALTLTCADGNKAVHLCREKKPELVFLDMMLPGRSGFLVLERIKGHADSPLVIMLTANEGKRHQTYATGLGADAYLQKPVSLELLVETAAKLLRENDELLAQPRQENSDDKDGD